MDILNTLKFSYNRSQILSTTLLHFRQITLLGIIVASEDINLFKNVFEIFIFNDVSTPYFLIVWLIFNCLVTLALMMLWSQKVEKVKCLLSPLSIFIKLYPYVFCVFSFYYCFYSIFHSETILIKLLGMANIPFMLAYLLLHEFINESLKFREIDFCNQKISSITGVVLVPLALLIVHLSGPFFGFLCCTVRAASELLSMLGRCEYVNLQRIKIFYSLFTFYFTFVHFLLFFNLFINSENIQYPVIKLGIITAGVLASWVLSKQTISIIWNKMLRFCKGSGERNEGETYDSDLPPLIKVQNELNILVQAFLERQKYLKDEKNYYNSFWRDFNQIVFNHKLKCEQPRCICHHSKHLTDFEVENELFVNNLCKRVTSATERLGKQMRLKVLMIYLLIEIAKKPLKGYFQLIMLKKQKIKAKLQLEINDLVSISRECFDQIFFKNKVQNQQLNLLKIIFYEETIRSLEDDVKGVLIESSHFLEIFRYNRLKIDQVQSEANKLVKKKEEIENKLESLIEDCYDNPSVNFCMFIFYRFLEPYRSKQAEFKKTAGQQSLKKRLLLKAEGEVISADQGIIYIDLVQDRGKIKKMTRNLCPAFGYAKEDMIGFNINLFMPTIFAKNHGKFLSNFIDKGRIKLLKEKVRVIFAKNKKKFIFPVNVRLKAQHLLDNEFGASALVSGVDTNSDFIIVGKHGKIEEITEGFFMKVFKKSFGDQIHKLSKLCLYKMIPGLNQIIESQKQHISKIYEGLFIYSDQEDYLLEKFRNTRDNSMSSAIGSKGAKSSSLSLLSNTTTNCTFNTKSQRFQFFSELFRSFLVDINPKRLKAFRISYKYSTIITAQFEVQLIELVTCKEELKGKQFTRQVLSELTNLGEIFQLIEEQSPIAQHLLKLQEEVEAETSLRQHSLGLQIRQEKQNYYLERQINQDETHKYINDNSEEQFKEDDMNEKKPLNCGNSQTSSVAGNTESESKKQLLINAFNSTQDVIPMIAKVCTIIAVISLLTLLLSMTLVELSSIDKVQKLWIDSSYILSLRLAYEFRLGLAQLTRFGQNLNFTIPQQLILLQDQLNKDMVKLCQMISTSTFNKELLDNPYSYYTPIYDPNRNLLYNATFTESVMKLTQLFTQESTFNQQTIRYNYENIHFNFTNFYKLRQTYYQDQSKQLDTFMTALFVVYEVVIGLVALSSIPMYIYFKQQQIAVRSKLSFMNQREIKKAVAKIHTILQYLKVPITKQTINKFQFQMVEKKYDKEEQSSGSKVIKITSESQDYKMFKKPYTYCLLLLFMLFFSNLSIILYSIFQHSNHTFLNSIQAHQIANDLETKTPLILNVYVSNLNRVLQGVSTWKFTQNTYDQTQKRYFKLIKEVALPQYQANKIAQNLKKGMTSPICEVVQCLNNTDLSLQDISQSFKNRFDYWNPSNQITPNLTTITNWLSQNSILKILNQVGYVLLLSTQGELALDDLFNEEQKWFWKLALVLSALLIPINLICLALILKKYLMEVNQMVKSAEQLYMNFPVQVLVQNTYLTSYFTAKIKEGK